jgi:uncharacterized membrane protein
MSAHHLHYNHLAGRSVERLAALSDGIFGVGMTLLMLDLRVPAHELIHDERGLLHALMELMPNIIAYLMSFLTLGIFWHGQQVELEHLKASDRHLSWLNLAFLFMVTMMPFSTKLLSEYMEYRGALVIYWLNILTLGVMLYTGMRYARKKGLVKPELTDEAVCAIESRILVGQALYAFGTALCIFNTYVSVGFIVLVQLNYAFAPGYRAIHNRLTE